MYDLIISTKRKNKIKIIITILLVILLIIISTILAMNKAEKDNNSKYASELENEQKKLQQNDICEKQEKQAEIKAEQDERLRKVNEPLTEQSSYNILHIYNSASKKRVFLTFDDGPTKAVTPFVLDVLKSKNVKATFFVLGTNASYNAEILQREYNEGHYIANHGYSHKYSEIYATPESTLNEFNQTQQIIRDALGNQSYQCKVFRFPGGSSGGEYNTQKQNSKSLLLQNGIVYLDWNSLSQDAAGKYTKEQLLDNVKNTLNGHDSVVILMHDSSDKILTYEMLPDLIDYLKQEKFEFKNIYDLLD